MALINCPECGKEISDKSKMCINCGFPIKPNNICKINGKEYDLSFLLDDSYSILYKVRDLIKISGSDISHVKPEIEKIIESKTIPSFLNLPTKTVQTNNKPRCPKCGSTQITTGARGVNHFWGFIGASKTVNRCGNCGHTWTPKG